MTNWSQACDEGVGYLRDLLKINTTNPPGNETAACEFLAGILKNEGIDSTILESQPGRGNLVARLKGYGRAAPLLLMVHLDVVPTEPENWSHPPFGGESADGYLYGRGALDTKELAAMELMVMLLLKRNAAPLARDVIFMANADEEAGGHLGAGWMVKQHPDLIRAEYALNEGGGFGSEILGKRVFTVQTGEKGTARFTLRARGKPGHGSIPHRDNALLKLAVGLQKLGAAQLPMHIVPTARLHIEGLAQAVGGKTGASLRTLLDQRNGGSSLERLPLDEGMRAMLYAMLHNTATPTGLHAGGKINVIPSLAEARVDARILPGQTKESFLRELRVVLDNSYEIDFHENVTLGLEADPQSPLYDTIKRVMKRHQPAAAVIPDLVVGATDARHVTRLGTKVYGFCPMFDQPSEMERVHGHDERVSLENVGFGTRVLYEVVSEFAANG
jgi:acetylornithine deacetylase/succinyl-diaminopimelate desuccinylase-like protein